MHVTRSIVNICFSEDLRPHLNDIYDDAIGGLPVRRKRSDQPVKRLLSNIIVLYDPEINETAKEVNNQIENISYKVTTVFDYVPKTIRQEAVMVKSIATLLRSLISPTCYLLKNNSL